MSELKVTPKRYQNPEIFEQLAMEYAVGSLQGRARQRFEVLMDTHFYLRATVDAYESKFANLVELLPDEEPSNKVWNNIEAHIKESTAESSQAQESKWWQTSFFKQGFGIAMMAMVVSVVLLYQPSGDRVLHAAHAYSAMMDHDESGKLTAITKIQKSEMKLSIEIMKPMAIADGMELTLWCQPKKGGKLMKMGTISKDGMTELAITDEQWDHFKDIDSIAVSVEKEGKPYITKPSGRIILKGKLNSLN